MGDKLLDESFTSSKKIYRKICWDTGKSLINAHALKNAHPPIWTLKMIICWTFLTKIPASNKRPLEIKCGKTDLTYCSMFPNSEFNCQKEQVVIFS